MKTFNENLYFITTGAEEFCEIIAYRSNRGQINIGDNALDLLGVDANERSFLIRNLFVGGDEPIIILSDSGALAVNRKMLYSTGICCIIQPQDPAEAVCYTYMNSGICRAIMSAKAKAMAGAAEQNDCAKAYLDISRMERMMSVFGEVEAVTDGDIERTANLVCDCIGCGIEISGGSMATKPFAMRGMIYSGSVYATAVLLMSFLAKIISDGRTLELRQGKDHVSLCINGDISSFDITKVTDYILHIAAQRELYARVNIESGISLEICPFFIDIGLAGVKNPTKLYKE